MIGCGWGKRRLRLTRCGVCRHLITFGHLGAVDVLFSNGIGGQHWCGHARCVRQIRNAVQIAQSSGSILRYRTAAELLAGQQL